MCVCTVLLKGMKGRSSLGLNYIVSRERCAVSRGPAIRIARCGPAVITVQPRSQIRDVV